MSYSPFCIKIRSGQYGDCRSQRVNFSFHIGHPVYTRILNGVHCTGPKRKCRGQPRVARCCLCVSLCVHTEVRRLFAFASIKVTPHSEWPFLYGCIGFRLNLRRNQPGNSTSIYLPASRRLARRERMGKGGKWRNEENAGESERAFCISFCLVSEDGVRSRDYC